MMNMAENPMLRMTRQLGSGEGGPEACMQRLLALETPEDARKIRDALEPGWQHDWAAAFNRAAEQVFKGD